MGRQGKANNTSEESNTGSAPDNRTPQDTVPELPPSAHNKPPGLSGLGQFRTAWDSTATDPLQHTGWSSAPAGALNFAIHTPTQDRGGDHDEAQRQGNFPRDNGEIHFNRNREKGLEKFDGKTAEFKPWRRRMTNYISEENEAYTKLMEWARMQKDVINEHPTILGAPKQPHSGLT